MNVFRYKMSSVLFFGRIIACNRKEIFYIIVEPLITLNWRYLSLTVTRRRTLSPQHRTWVDSGQWSIPGYWSGKGWTDGGVSHMVNTRLGRSEIKITKGWMDGEGGERQADDEAKALAQNCRAAYQLLLRRFLCPIFWPSADSWYLTWCL